MQVNLFNGKYHSGGHTSDNSLGAVMLNKPYVMEEIIHTIGKKYDVLLITEGKGKTYSLNKKNNKLPNLPGSTETVGSKVVQWPLMGYKGKLTTVLTAPNHNGANNVPFVLELEDDYFRPGDIIIHPSGTHSRVYGEPTFNGRGYVYQATVMSPTRLLRALDDMSANSSVSKGHAVFGERSQTGYSDWFAPEYMQNYTTLIRKSASISGTALSNVTWLGTENTKGGSKGEKIWWYEAETQAMDQLFFAREFSALWGQRTVSADGRFVALKDENGEPVWTGDGIMEQLKYSTRRLYNPGQTDIDFWLGLISDLNINSDSPEGKKYTFIGGYDFISEASRALFDYARGLGNLAPIVVDRKADSLALKAHQVTSLQGILGAEIEFKNHWMFSDPKTWGHSRHPVTGRPLMSYTGIVIDTSTYNGHPNLMRFVKGNSVHDRGYIRKVVNNMVSLPGESSPFAASGKDVAEVHWMCEEMFALLNPYSSAIVEASIA